MIFCFCGIIVFLPFPFSGIRMRMEGNCASGWAGEVKSKEDKPLQNHVFRLNRKLGKIQRTFRKPSVGATGCVSQNLGSVADSPVPLASFTAGCRIGNQEVYLSALQDLTYISPHRSWRRNRRPGTASNRCAWRGKSREQGPCIPEPPAFSVQPQPCARPERRK